MSDSGQLAHNEGPDADRGFPASGKIAAIDYGTVRIGVAICDPERIVASPLEVVDGKQHRKQGDLFRKLAEREQLRGFVVGLPVHLDGRESEKSQEARKFAVWLAAETLLPVRMFDERFSTAAADQLLSPSRPTKKQRKKRIDAVAAQVLLESFLEASKHSDSAPGIDPQSTATGADPIDQ